MRGEEALAEGGLLSASRLTVPRLAASSSVTCLGGPVPASGAPSRGGRGRARRCRTSPIASALADGELGGSRLPRRDRRPGTAPARGSTSGTPLSAGSRAAATSPPPARCGGPRVVEPVLQAGQLAEHGVPRTCSHGSSTVPQPVFDPVAAPRRCVRRRRPRWPPWLRTTSWRPGPTAGPARRRASGCAPSAPSLTATRPRGRRRRPGGSRHAPAARRPRSSSASVRGRGHVGAGPLDVAGRRLDPAAEQQRGHPVAGRSGRPRRRPGRPGAVPLPCCRRGRPTPSRSRSRWLSASDGSLVVLQLSAASMLARSSLTNRRCSAWCAAPDARGGRLSRRRRTTRRATRRRPVGHPRRRSIASSANARMLSSRRYRTDPPSPSSTITSERPASRPTTSMVVRGRHVERAEDMTRPRRAAMPSVNVGKRPQTPLVVGEQQVVAPGDRRAQRPAALGSPARRVAEDGEPVVETSGDLLDGQRPRACRGELDRERQAIE